MKKLYLISQQFPPTAFALKRYWYAHALMEAGFNVDVITTLRSAIGFEDPDSEIYLPDIKVIRLPAPHWGGLGKLLFRAGITSCEEVSWSWYVEKYLTRRLRIEPGVVLAIYPPIASLTGGLKAAKACRCPVVLDFREPFAPGGKILSGLISISFTSLWAWLICDRPSNTAFNFFRFTGASPRKPLRTLFA